MVQKCETSLMKLSRGEYTDSVDKVMYTLSKKGKHLYLCLSLTLYPQRFAKLYPTAVGNGLWGTVLYH